MTHDTTPTNYSYRPNKAKHTEASYMSNMSEKMEEQTEECVDEEGLRKKYDVIICGTGLIQSILASALSRAGKSVLHCDGNSFYGELDSVLSLGSMIEWFKELSSRNARIPTDNCVLKDNHIPLDPRGGLSTFQVGSFTQPSSLRDLEVGTEVVTPYGLGKVHSLPRDDTEQRIGLEVELYTWKMANNTSPIVHFGFIEISSSNQSLSDLYATHHGVVALKSAQYEAHINTNERMFALDLNPCLLYATGDAVEGMIDSGVSHYCEFKSLLGLYLFMDELGSTTASGEKRGLLKLSRVPCSRSDVFNTRLLKNLDKRKLVKFLQVAQDYAFATSSSNPEDEDGTSENEDKQEDIVTSLNERQLQRGRSLYRPQNKTVNKEALESLKQHIKDGMSFETYLEKHHNLPDRLRSIIIHAIALGIQDDSYSVETGMNDISKHLQSLGRYGGTAFLVPLYGSGEFSQAFSRSAAVHGATYVLRRFAKEVVLNEEKSSVSGIILGSGSLDGVTFNEKEISAEHVVSPAESLSCSHDVCCRRVLRRISVLRGKLIQGTGASTDQRHILVIPPNKIGNSNVIYGIVVDESVSVAPHSFGNSFTTCVLHLSTIHDERDPENILEQAIQNILSQEDMRGVEEMHQFTFSFSERDSQDESNRIAGLHEACRQNKLTVDNAFDEAQRIFEKICPNQNFLCLSEEMDQLVNERRVGNEDDDHDGVMLENAMNLVQPSS